MKKALLKIIQDRDRLLSDVRSLVHSEYKDDREMQAAMGNLFFQVKLANEDDQMREFLADMRGFWLWATQTQQKPGLVLTTMIHDLSEFTRNRNEKWFCPRTTGYRKYLTGASNV